MGSLSGRQQFDQNILGFLQQEAEAALERGADPDRVIEVAGEALVTSTLEIAPRVTASFLKEVPRLLRAEKKRRKNVRRQIRNKWGHELDGFVVLRTACREATVEFGDDVRDEANAERDHVFEVLERVSSLSLRIASEVLHLCTNGLPSAAMARTRSLHELTVTAWIIGEYGRRPEYADLAERYLMHPEIGEYPAALRLSKSNEEPDELKMSPEDLARLEGRFHALLAKYGKPFRREWGWAAPLFEDANDCHLSGLERLADAEGLRAQYAESSGLVHGGSSAAALNIYESEDMRYKVTDATDKGLIPPLWYASGHLANCSVVLLAKGRENTASPRDLIMVNVVSQLLDEYREGLRARAGSSGHPTT